MEMQNFQKNLQKLEAADTQVLGVSMDSPLSNAAWAEKEGFKFPILSDWGGDFTKQLGIYNTQYHAARRCFSVASLREPSFQLFKIKWPIETGPPLPAGPYTCYAEARAVTSMLYLRILL